MKHKLCNVVSDHYKIQEICDKAIERNLCMLEFVPDDRKTQEIYEEAVLGEYAPNYFVI